MMRRGSAASHASTLAIHDREFKPIAATIDRVVENNADGADGADGARDRRGRGGRAGLSRARIVEAARGLDADELTVKAVADRLGVDRAAVHHHVSDLDTLRELIALDAFTLRFAPVEIPSGADWREACRLLAVSMYEAVLSSGRLGTYVRFRSIDVALLEPVEQTLRIMMAAGFDDETAARSLAALASLATDIARERLLTDRPVGHPQVPGLLEALEQRGPELTVLRRLAEADLVSYNDAQLDTSLELVLDGMAARLTRLQQPAPPPAQPVTRAPAAAAPTAPGRAPGGRHA
jgi:TetR/AcrR family transcriptional regulator, tetracycline repressor protein